MAGWKRVRMGAWRSGLVAALMVVALGLAGVPLAANHWRSHPSAHASSPEVDPRLLIVPRTTVVQARLGEARLEGRLSPTIPGSNDLRLEIRNQAGTRVRGGRLHVRVTMPGMRMAPILATLMPQAGGYHGTLILPMFGRYQAEVAADTANGRDTGTLLLVLLPPALTTVP